MRCLCRWFAWVWTVWAVSAVGQAYRTPVRASWTEPSSTSATIAWDSPSAARGIVRHGTTTNFGRVAIDGGGTHRHELALRQLAPGTRHYYEASSPDGFVQAGTFLTAREEGQPLHLVFHGDLQGGIDEGGARGVADQIVMEDPQWVQHLGDMAEEAFSGSGIETWNTFFRICSNELANLVFMPMMGNHDAAPGSDFTRGLYHRMFAVPEPSAGNGYYAYSVGNIRFILLNSEGPIGEQGDWLARELQAAANDPRLVWLMVLCHRPPYSWGERSGWDEGRDNWSPILVRYEADWMVSGHSHNYQRMVPIRGVRYLVAGGGGGRLYESAVGETAHAFATSCYHHVSVHVTNDVMQLRGIRSDGRVFDSTIVTNRRQVRVEPSFPVRGRTAKISYRATEGPLSNANPVYIHLGQDAFSGAFASEPMAWNSVSQRWEYEFTVPVSATQRLAFVFYNGSNVWHNNFDHNWQSLLERAWVSPDPPMAGGSAMIHYEADMGILSGASSIVARVGFNGGDFPEVDGMPMARRDGSRWECEVAVPPHARDMAFSFTGAGGIDDNHKRFWTFPVIGATNKVWRPSPIAAWGTPFITDDPPNELPDNVGDNFDLRMEGPPLVASDEPLGFGGFGKLWFNADETNLYVGGFGMDLGGSNNVAIVFLGIDTLTDNAWNLWHKTGLPNALDYLHNVRFTEPMDVALILGDAFADGPSYPSFTYCGYDFGQGVYYLGTNWGEFVVMDGAKLSQFHGMGTEACVTQGHPTSRATTRWEAALPWAALGGTGPESASNLFVCGVFASSSVRTNDRYLSRTYLGDCAWGQIDDYGRYGFHSIHLRPARVNFLHGDLRGDGLSNEWRQERFGTPDGPCGDEDTDGDGFDNRAEEIAGTHPNDGRSYFAVSSEAEALRWPFVSRRFYDVYFSPDMIQAFQPLDVGLSTNAYLPAEPGFYHIRARK